MRDHTPRYSPEFDEDPPCDICGGDPCNCECPVCPVCGACGDPKCYDLGHLEPADDSVKAFCDHVGISPIGDALQAAAEHVWLVLRCPHPRSGKIRIHHYDRMELDFLPEWTRLNAVGVEGTTPDGCERSIEIEAGGDWTEFDRTRERFNQPPQTPEESAV